MEEKIEKIVIKGVTYVPEGEALSSAPTADGLEYKIVRTYSAGVFAGYLESLEGKKAVIRNARRIWSWEGANSLSDLAIIGTTKPSACRFTLAVDKVILTEAVEILSVTEEAFISIQGVAAWTQKK